MAEAMAVKRVVSITPNFFEKLRKKRKEKTEQRQIAKDEKIFEDIRNKIMNKVFEDYKGDIQKNQKQIEEFVKQIEEYRKTTNIATDAINNALGAAGTNASVKHNSKTNKLNLANTFGSGLSAAIAALIESGDIKQSFITNLLQCLSPASALGFIASAFTPPLVGPLVSIAATVLVATSTFIVNKHFSKKANLGLNADYVGKMEEAVKQWEVVNKQLAELNEVLTNDKAELIRLYKENKSQKNKSAVLDEYINSKLMPKLVELGIFDGSLSIANYFKKEFASNNQQLEQVSDKDKEKEVVENDEKKEVIENNKENVDLEELKKLDEEIQRI